MDEVSITSHYNPNRKWILRKYSDCDSMETNDVSYLAECLTLESVRNDLPSIVDPERSLDNWARAAVMLKYSDENINC